MTDGPIRDIVDVAVTEARGPVAFDRAAGEVPQGLLATAMPLSGLRDDGRPFHIFIVGIDRVGDPEAVISHAD